MRKVRDPESRTHSKVESDLLALLLVVGVETSLLVGDELVSQCCRRNLRGKQGDQPVCDCCQLHRGLRVAMCMLGGGGKCANATCSFLAATAFATCHAGCSFGTDRYEYRGGGGTKTGTRER